MQYGILVEVLKARRRTLAAVFAFVLVAVAAAFLIPGSRYTATAVVAVEARGSIDSGSPTALLSLVSSEMELMRSERVALRVVKDVGLDEDGGWRELWLQRTEGRGDFRSWVAEQVLKRVDIRYTRDSNVITLTYTSHYPEVAARMATAFVRAYTATSKEVRQAPIRETRESLDVTVAQLLAAFRAAQARLSEFQRTNKFVADERVDIEAARLSELGSQVNAVEAVAINAAGRRRQTVAGDNRVEEVLRDPVVSGLSSELARQEARLTELRSRLGEQHPAIIEARNGVQELRSRVDAAMQRAGTSTDSEDKIAAERLSRVRTALNSQRSKVIEQRSLKDQAQILRKDVENAQRAYEIAATRTSQAIVDSGAINAGVSVLKMPSFPTKPAGPPPALIAVLGVIMAAVLGVLGALLHERLDRRIRFESDLSLYDPQLVTVVPRARVPAMATRLLTSPT